MVQSTPVTMTFPPKSLRSSIKAELSVNPQPHTRQIQETETPSHQSESQSSQNTPLKSTRACPAPSQSLKDHKHHSPPLIWAPLRSKQGSPNAVVILPSHTSGSMLPRSPHPCKYSTATAFTAPKRYTPLHLMRRAPSIV